MLAAERQHLNGLKLRVFGVSALGLIHRIFLGVLLDFLENGFTEIETQVVRQFEKKTADICDLLRYGLPMAFNSLLTFLSCFPEKMFKEFTGLDGESSRHVLGVVELHPVPFVTEGLDCLGNFLN